MFSVISRTPFYYSTAVLLSLFSATAFAGKTTRVSVASAGTQAVGESPYMPSISADGRYVTFISNAANLVSGDTNNTNDVFVTDLLMHKTTRVSVASNGVQGNDASWSPILSADGRYVVFSSEASNLVAGDTNANTDVFIHDRTTKQTTRISIGLNGVQGNGQSGWNVPSISADGRYVTFDSEASNLVAGDGNESSDVFIHDRLSKKTMPVSARLGKVFGNDNSGWNRASISTDGRYVAFDSDASNLVAGDTNESADVFVYDHATKQTTRVSVASTGEQGSNWSWQPSLSSDGRYVTFESYAPNLVAGDTNDRTDIFIHDRQTKQTTRLNVAGGRQGNDESFNSSVSADGRYVAFQSYASNLVTGDTNENTDIFIHDRSNKQVTRVSVNSAGTQGAAAAVAPAISANGRYVVFSSDSANLVTGDSNNAADIFVHDRMLDTKNSADIKIVVTKKPPTLKPSSNGSYTYTITNNGPNTAANVNLVHVVPNGGYVVNFIPSQGACTRYAMESLCYFGQLLKGKSVIVTVAVKASANTLVQQLTVSADSVDIAPTNNVASVSTAVKP